MTVLTGSRVVTPDGVLDPGWVRLHGGRIVEVGAGDTATADGGGRRPDATVAAAATTTARVLGQHSDLGAIAAGLAADLVILDDDLTVHAVLHRGSWVPR